MVFLLVYHSYNRKHVCWQVYYHNNRSDIFVYVLSCPFYQDNHHSTSHVLLESWACLVYQIAAFSSCNLEVHFLHQIVICLPCRVVYFFRNVHLLFQTALHPYFL
uniref:Uncharacterized protein n=1 Tax=Cacopsylla melanoneura TaxID=428564 RepID=A0A8D9E2V9_9HEMI